MQPTFFAKQSDFRQWLLENHKKETEIIVGFYKLGTGIPSITWPQSVDEAICFGWIDGIRRTIDQVSYSIRFTPRRPASIWSAVNIKKAEELIKNGQMRPEGLLLFQNRREDKSQIYSYEKKPEKLSDFLEAKFAENSEAWLFFKAQAPSWQKTMVYWIMSAKQDATQISRLEKLMMACEQQKRLL
jgi:uncharacterized protein YdeI (YjbR/CyaY-like superfamily)